MLLRAERDRAWKVDEICEALACPRSWAVAQLDAMASAGLLASADGKWRFAPASSELEHATAALEEAYRLHSRDVVRFVFATPGSDLKHDGPRSPVTGGGSISSHSEMRRKEQS